MCDGVGSACIKAVFFVILMICACQNARRIACDSRAIRRIALAIGVCYMKIDWDKVGKTVDLVLEKWWKIKKTVKSEKKVGQTA